MPQYFLLSLRTGRTDGPDGTDGQDGRVGRDGRDGRTVRTGRTDGLDGTAGRAGRDRTDGPLPETAPRRLQVYCRAWRFPKQPREGSKSTVARAA